MRTAFVTGGSRGIGRAIVEELAQAGTSRIVFTYRRGQEEAQDLEASLRKKDIQATAIRLDLLESERIATVVEEAMQDGRFDIVVHNAGSADDTPFYFMDERQWQDVIGISLNSFFHINKVVLPEMIRARWGRIICLASISGEAGNRGQVNYGAAKGAIIAATKSLAREVGRKGVLANVVSPGVIETDMTRDLPHDEIKKLIPLGRYGQPSEVAKVVRFLASDDASYVNGAVIRVNGGMYT